MIRVVVKFKSFPIMIYKTAAAVQKILRMSADAVLFCQCFGTEFAVRLCLVQFDDPLLAILKTGTMLAQFILNLGPVSYTHLDVYKRQVILLLRGVPVAKITPRPPVISSR